MTRYSIEPRIRKYVNGYDLLLFGRNLFNKYERQLLHTTTKTRLDTLELATKKLAHKAADATVQFIENKIVEIKL